MRFAFRSIGIQILSCQIRRIPQSPTRRYPVHLEAPPSPDYVPGPEEPEQAPLSPDFVPEPVYPKFMPSKDDDKEDPKEDPEEDPINYPADGGDDDDDEDESSNDDEDDDDDVKEDEDEEEEEEHPALADSILPPVHRVTARILHPPYLHHLHYHLLHFSSTSMDSTQASSFNPSKKIKLTIIPPRQLFVNIYSDEDDTTTPSLITKSSSPSPLNALSKTPSTKDTSSTFGTTSSLFELKPQSSPPSSNDSPSP
ncbi:hypothetical protein Tco_0877119 [Tanacetum coccineum]|uniref:Uncharacterized protein n=1 Tax=Tanacetum coccineum TaxID=301880 RepID=A0ABQ5BVQ5_9ASTR